MYKKIQIVTSLILLVLFCSFSTAKKTNIIHGIALIRDPKEMLSSGQTETVEELFAVDLYVPRENKLKKELKRFFGLPFTKENISNIRQAIVSHFHRAGLPFAIVELPPQDVSNGVLQLVVTSAKVGEVKVEGTKYTDIDLIRGYISADPGEFVDQRALAGDLDFMNRNPFRSASLIYSPGEQRNTTDITVFSDDRMPVQVYVGAQNNGVDSTGRNRYFAGLSWGRFFGLDHILSYQYTTSGDFHKFQGHTVQYLALLSWKHILNIYGGYATVNPELDFPSRDASGESYQGSLRYNIPLPTDMNFSHELFFGFDFKRTNNNAQFSEDLVPISSFGRNVNLFQLVLGYKGQYRPGRNVLNYDFQLVGSPGEWLPDQTDADYASLRPEAENQWIYGKFYLSFLQVIPADFVIYAASQGQVSLDTLLPSEQLGIGGYDTVRGYAQREYNADNGIIINLELRTPPWGVFRRSQRDITDNMQFLAFFDYGWGSQVTSIAGIPSNQGLMGVGPGFRYTVGSNVSVRLDWGFRLITNQDVGGDGSRLHFSALVSY